MPELPIKFNKGISRLAGAPLESPYNIQNARITPYDEVVAFKHGTTRNYHFIPKEKPWVKFDGRWFDNEYHDSSAQYRNRLYLSKITDNGGGSYSTWNIQAIEGASDIENLFHYRDRKRLSKVGGILYTNLGIGHESGDAIFNAGLTWDTFGNRGYAASDTGVQGITVGRAVDYILVPIDRYGQAGPWSYVTAFADFDPTSYTTITGAGQIVTRIPVFSFPQLAVASLFEPETAYVKVQIYRSIEYDLHGLTTDASSSESIPYLGGFYYVGDTAEEIWQDTAYWPFDIADTTGIADQLGPPLDRNRNQWGTGDFESNGNVAAKTMHNDAGTIIYGNVATPTKIPSPGIYLRRKISTISATFSAGPNTINRASGSWITDGYNDGDYIYVIGAATGSNNRKYTITNVTASNLTVSETPTAEGPTAGVRVTTAPKTGYQYRYLKPDATYVNNYDSAPFFWDAEYLSIPWDGEDGLDVYTQIVGDVVNIDHTTDQITIKGDWTGFFGPSISNGGSFVISGTASNNGTFNVSSGGVASVYGSTGGTLTFDAGAKTITRTAGSWITDGYTTGQPFTVYCNIYTCSNALQTYTITGAVTASTITLVETPASEVLTDYSIVPQSVVLSGGNTVIKVTENITVTEAATGEFTFYALWESLTPDNNGRYTSVKQNPGQYYSFDSQGDDYDFYNPADYYDSTALSAMPNGQLTIRNESRAYLSEANAPWTVTYDGFDIPDSASIRAILPSRAEEIEQLTSYEFYVLTDNRIYVGIRDGRDVSLTTVESSTGVDLGADGQALAVPVKGGIAFYGTDKNLYYLTGRRLEKLSFDILPEHDRIWDSVDDIAYDPRNDWLYVQSQNVVLSDSDVYIYDFDTQRWIGAYDVNLVIPGFWWEYRITDLMETTDGVNHQLGSNTPLIDGIIDQTNFKVYVKDSPALNQAFNILVDRSGGGTDTIAVVEQPDYPNYDQEWNIASGDILSGDVTINLGDTLRVTINDPGSIVVDGNVYIYIKGFQSTSTNVAIPVTGVGFDYDLLLPVFGYSFGYGSAVLEEKDASGDTLTDAEIELQEMGSILVNELQMLKFDYDGLYFESLGTFTAGSDQLTNTNSGDVFVDARDRLATIYVTDGGQNISGAEIDLRTFIESVSGSVATLVDNCANTHGGGGKIIKWRTSGDVTITIIDNMFRSRILGPIRVRPYKNLYPHNTKSHRMRIKFADFETLREILIITKNQLESD